jgi:hypothetical protein
MTLPRVLLAAALATLSSGICRAQEAIEPDRPDVTNGAHIVGPGLLQIEFGGMFTHPQAGQSAFGSPFTARIGLFAWLEGRVGTDGLLVQSNENGRATGMGNVQVGAKVRVWSSPDGLALLSVLPAITLPTASADKGLGSGIADYTIAVLTGTDLGSHAHVDANYGIGAIGSADSQPRFAQHLVSVSVNDALSEHWNPYVEVFWFSQQEPGGRSLTSIDSGALYQIGSRYALDAGVQFGLSERAPALAVFGGLSMIVGDVLGERGVRARDRLAQARRARARDQK